MIHIDKARALQLLSEAVLERGADYVYKKQRQGLTCLYSHGSEPGCIVGVVLHKAGVPLEKLGDFDNAMFGSALAELFDEGELAGAGVDMTGDAVRVLSIAQGMQDAGFPWGDAVKQAVA